MTTRSEVTGNTSFARPLLAVLALFSFFLLAPLAAPATAASASDLRQIVTTGSIGAGSNQLIVSSAAGFRVNDSVIVEIGKEPGQGQRGTRGVGGTWPEKSYPTEAQLLADKPQQNIFAWEEASGYAYWWVDGVWYNLAPSKPMTYSVGSYYLGKAIPRSLQARITAINGNTLTLDRPGIVSVAGANVYLDTAPIINEMIAENSAVVLPPGNFPVGGVIWIYDHPGFVLAGQGKDQTKLYSPKGVPSASIEAGWSPNTLVKDLTLQGNFRDQGFGLNWIGSTPPGSHQPVTETDFPQSASWPRGIFFNQGSHRSVAQDARVIDVSTKAVGVAAADEVWAYRVENVQNDPLRTYIQWQFQWTDTTGGGCVDCEVRSTYVIPGFEAFKSTNVQFIRPKGTNAVMAMNGSGGWLVEDAKLTFTANSLYMESDPLATQRAGPIIIVNAFIGNTPQMALGGTIRNVTMIQEGYMTSDNDTYMGIVIVEGVSNIKIEGAAYYAPDYKDATGSWGAIGLHSRGLRTVVDGTVVVGKSRPGYHNIYVQDGSARNCSAEFIVGCSAGTFTSSALNQFLAARAAGGVSSPSTGSATADTSPSTGSATADTSPSTGSATAKGDRVVDATGALWTFGAGKETLRNGVHVGLGTGLEYLFLVNTVYVRGTDQRWYRYSGAQWVLDGDSAPTGSATSSPTTSGGSPTASGGSPTASGGNPTASGGSPTDGTPALTDGGGTTAAPVASSGGANTSIVTSTGFTPPISLSLGGTHVTTVTATGVAQASRRERVLEATASTYSSAGSTTATTLSSSGPSSVSSDSAAGGASASTGFKTLTATTISLIPSGAASGASGGATVTVGGGASAPANASVAYDFAGNKISGILWRNQQTGQNAIWEFNGGILAKASLIAGAGTNWQVVGRGDFDGDGRADILWRDADGNISMWLMNGTTVASSTVVGLVPTSWKVVATGDFDGNGKTDIVWRDSNGKVVLWLMNGTTIESNVEQSTVPWTWAVEGTGDFNGDGKADILWRQSDGTTHIWLMDGTKVIGSTSFAVAGAEWSIVGVADYDGDGKADILWRSTSGQNAIWLMNATTLSSAVLIPAVPDVKWTIVGSGDYDGDGKADVLWRNVGTGDNALWRMDGLAIKHQELIPSLVDPNWTVMKH